MNSWRIAQMNVATTLYRLEDPRIAEANALADAGPEWFVHGQLSRGRALTAVSKEPDSPKCHLPVKNVLCPAVFSTDLKVHTAAGRPPPWPWKATVVMPLRLGMRPTA
jgi:hypothetical protein